MNDPIYIEKAFNTLMSSLSGLVSKRQKLSAICDFLEYLVPQLQEYTSYLEQLIPLVPEFSNPYEFTGIDPAELSHQAHLLKQATQQTKLESSLAAQKVDSLERAVAQSYDWIGERSHSEFLDHALIPFDSRLPIQQGIHSVLVPVVETLGTEPTGRLRNIVLKLAGTTPAKQHELTPTFGILSDSSDQPGSIQKAATSANGLLGELGIHSKKKWQATVGFEHSQAWHSGESANTAISGLFFCSILEAMELREQFRLNPAVAISGGISEAGEIQSISEGTLPAKVEAAFYSWTQVLVVPQSQLGRVLARYEELKQTYSKRNLLIIGTSNLRELFYDRRLTLHSKKSPLEHTTQRLWRRKFSALAILSYLLLFVTTAVLIIGPIDRNPASVNLAGTTLSLINSKGYEIHNIEVGQDYVDHHNQYRALHRYVLLDVDDDGVNELIYAHQGNDFTRSDTLYCYSVLAEKMLWKREIRYDLDYSHRPDVVDLRWNTSKIALNKFKDRATIVVASNAATYFPSVLAEFDPSNGQVLQKYINPGALGQIRIEDLDSDGKNEILAFYNSNTFWGATLAILNAENFDGHAPSYDAHKALEIEFAPIYGLVYFPKSIVDRLYTLSKGTYAYDGLEYNENGSLITLQAYGGRVNDRGLTPAYVPAMVYTFNKELEVVGIGSSDGFDILAREYFENGTLSFEPGIEYLSAFKDSLEWWDGQQFVNYPTLVNPYPDE